MLPYMDRGRKGVGVWFSRERKVAITIFSLCCIIMFVLTVIGTSFRGPNWSFQIPWKPHVVAEEH
jgi:quinol-cytochrome oxidoreductase complex cytochrome b subunit